MSERGSETGSKIASKTGSKITSFGGRFLTFLAIFGGFRKKLHFLENCTCVFLTPLGIRFNAFWGSKKAPKKLQKHPKKLKTYHRGGGVEKFGRELPPGVWRKAYFPLLAKNPKNTSIVEKRPRRSGILGQRSMARSWEGIFGGVFGGVFRAQNRGVFWGHFWRFFWCFWEVF